MRRIKRLGGWPRWARGRWRLRVAVVWFCGGGGGLSALLARGLQAPAWTSDRVLSPLRVDFRIRRCRFWKEVRGAGAWCMV